MVGDTLQQGRTQGRRGRAFPSVSFVTGHQGRALVTDRQVHPCSADWDTTCGGQAA